MKFHLQPIPELFLQRVRETGIDDQGQPVKRVIAVGGEPCRDVLRRASPGEELILASHSPFHKPGPYKEYGPIFVLANPSSEPVRRNVLPLADGSETAYFRSHFVMRAYGADEAIVDATLVDTGTANDVLQQYFDRDDVAFVDMRFPTYGCFSCRAVRA